jgi:hypothetical protein
MRIVKDKGEFTSMRCANPCMPFSAPSYEN